MQKIEQVRKEMMQALKEGNVQRKEALSLLLSALKAKFVEKRADLTEEEENIIIQKEIKQAKETLASAPQNRTDIIEECKLRIAAISEFAPKLMSEEEIQKNIKNVLTKLKITSLTIKDKGIIMKNLMTLLKGKADTDMINTELEKIIQNN